MKIDPIKGSYYISQGWNAYSTRYPQWGNRHKGIDFAGAKGLVVVSISSGVVVERRARGNWGNLVVVQDGDKKFYYAHLNEFKTFLGKDIQRGEEIGTVGSTGMSTGPHLHLGVKLRENWVDPDPYLTINEEDIENMNFEELKRELEKHFVKRDIRVNQDEQDGSVWIVDNGKRYKVGTQQDDLAMVMSMIAGEKLSDVERNYPITKDRKEVL